MCRNERLRLPAFLNHYRSLGVDEFLVIDNDSSDGSTEYLAAQADVGAAGHTANVGKSHRLINPESHARENCPQKYPRQVKI